MELFRTTCLSFSFFLPRDMNMCRGSSLQHTPHSVPVIQSEKKLKTSIKVLQMGVYKI